MHKSQKTLPLNADPPYFSSRRTQITSPSNTSPYEFPRSRNHRPALQTETSEKYIEIPDSLPSFGTERRQVSFGEQITAPRSRLRHDFQNEVLARRLSEASPTSLRSPLGQSRLSAGVGMDYGLGGSRGLSASKDLKNSSSYLNAMKALQAKVKHLEQQMQIVEIEKGELGEKHRRDIEALGRKFEEERRSLLEFENGLKNRLKLLEDDLKERDKHVSDMNRENDRIRKLGYESEVERTEELQKVLSEKARIKDEYRDLTLKFEDKKKAEEDLRGRASRLEGTIREKDGEIIELNEKIRRMENEKTAQTRQFELKLSDLVIKNKQEEERRKEWEAQYQEEIKRRMGRDEEVSGELESLKIYIQELEDRTNQAEKRLHLKEDELMEKNAQVLKLKNEIETMIRDQEKAKAASERAHIYAQDMAQINHRLISSMMDKSQGADLPSAYQTISTQNLRENTGGFADSVGSDVPVRRQRSEFGRVDNYSNYKTPKSAGKVFETTSRTNGWSVASPKYRGGDDFTSGGRIRSPRTRSPNDFHVGSGEKAMNISRVRSGPEERLSRSRGRSGNKEDREAARDRLEREEVIKEIIEVEKEVLEWNREYQRLMTEMLVRYIRGNL